MALTPAQQAELWRRLEHAAALLGDQFYGELVIRVEGGQLRWADVRRRLRKTNVAAATSNGNEPDIGRVPESPPR